jgi:hypothetical protein
MGQLENARTMRARWKVAELCNTCGAESTEGYKTCERCRNRFNRYTKVSRKKYKTLIYDHYGRECACCGEIEMLFLSIDHINGDGAIHRKEIGKSPDALYRWIVKNNFPDTFEILCRNCNWGRHANHGTCPHLLVD